MRATTLLLSQAAHSTPSPDNSQPWHLIWQGEQLTVAYDAERVAGKTFDADSHATLITFGALAENLTQAATHIDAELDWTFPQTLDAHHPNYFQTTIKRAGIGRADEIPLFGRHTNRFPFHQRPIDDNELSLLKNLTQGKARIMVFEDSAEIRTIGKLVQSASELRFQTRQVHEWLAKSLRFDTRPEDIYGEGLDVATIDLPPGGRLFLRMIGDWQRMTLLNKLGIYKVMAMIDSQPVAKAPMIMAIVGPEGFRETMDAGRLLNRAWIALNENRIAAHPYYVVADQLQRRLNNTVPSHLSQQVETLFDQSRRLFQFGDNETLHMLFRVGYPKKTPVRSKRLTLKDVCSGIELN